MGFPGETEADFEDTLNLVRKVGYDSAFTFLYSVRQGTPAAAREDQVPEEVKHERFNRLVEEINSSSAEKNKAYVGRVEKVLVDGVSRNRDNAYEGRTDSFKLVNFEGPEGLEGQIVPVKDNRRQHLQPRRSAGRGIAGRQYKSHCVFHTSLLRTSNNDTLYHHFCVSGTMAGGKGESRKS